MSDENVERITAANRERMLAAPGLRHATEEEISRVELNKWVWRLKAALDKAYGHDCECVNTLEIVVQAIAHIEYVASKHECRFIISGSDGKCDRPATHLVTNVQNRYPMEVCENHAAAFDHAMFKVIGEYPLTPSKTDFEK